MRKFVFGVCFLGCMLIEVAAVQAQRSESPINIFGYFQTQFTHQSGGPLGEGNSNSFLLQQLNVFLQKNLAKDFASLIDVEILNSFSSAETTGALNIQEAWVRYRADRRLNIKVGLQIPTFNHLNTIKNRTPVLPYVVRPLVYEDSFDQLASIEEYLPSKTFLQAYGAFSLQPTGLLKLDYSLMLGNSPDIRTNEDRGQSGVDSTNTFLVGGRLGVRWLWLKAGVSITHEKVNRFRNLAAQGGIPIEDLTGIPRIRLGYDVRIALGPATFEGEYIHVQYDEDVPILQANKTFYYGTLSWLIQDRLLLYGSYWVTRENRVLPLPGTMEAPIDIEGIPAFVSTNKSPSFGVAFYLMDRITLKGQYTRILRSTNDNRFRTGPTITTYSLGVSVFF